jgi:hypothetical protein
MSVAGPALVNGCAPLPFAKQSRAAQIGYLWTGSPLTAYAAAAFHDGLRDAGWVEGQNGARTESGRSQRGRSIVRITGGNFRLVERLFAQIQRVGQINEVVTLTPELVEAVQESLVIGGPESLPANSENLRR